MDQEVKQACNARCNKNCNIFAEKKKLSSTYAHTSLTQEKFTYSNKLCKRYQNSHRY